MERTTAWVMAESNEIARKLFICSSDSQWEEFFQAARIPVNGKTHDSMHMGSQLPMKS
jgi:hypothetical protein